jgi:hypothetical protein
VGVTPCVVLFIGILMCVCMYVNKDSFIHSFIYWERGGGGLELPCDQWTKMSI